MVREGEPVHFPFLCLVELTFVLFFKAKMGGDRRIGRLAQKAVKGAPGQSRESAKLQSTPMIKLPKIATVLGKAFIPHVIVRADKP